MDPQFNQPGTSSGDRIDLKDNLGRLLLIYPKKIEVGVPTEGLGLKDPLVADVVVLDGPSPGQEYHDTFIFPGVLIGQLKQYIGHANPALGRLTYGEAKPGKNAPYQLSEYSAQDAAIASAWVNAHPRGFTQPAPAQQPPAAQQNGGHVDISTGEITEPAAAPAGVNIDTIRALLGLNLPDQTIADNTGATLAQVQAIRNLPVS
jgi:hypothetical protein